MPITIKDLINLLELQDPDAPVAILDSRTNSILWLDDLNGKVIDEKDGIVMLIGS
ncbi:hypothetical protein [Lactiplantibacillus pingfangensis]|uniref:hypothetical protein n=1 Tax=Lactiplantibacillus pingfangensis TaxID=2559915 RepID=UPI001485B7CD|nr:hypothetical protein [Lactiplantibacillus pingfangensis]